MTFLGFSQGQKHPQNLNHKSNSILLAKYQSDNDDNNDEGKNITKGT